MNSTIKTRQNISKKLSWRIPGLLSNLKVLCTLFVLNFISSKAFSQAANIDQIRNGKLGVYTPTPAADWVNGNAGPSNAHFAEGYSIPYRMSVTGLVGNATTVHHLIIEWDTKHGNGHAIDYITHYQNLDNPQGSHLVTFGHGAEVVNPTLGTAFSGAPTLFQIPAPSSAGSEVAGQPAASFNALAASTGNSDITKMAIWGGTIVSLTYLREDAQDATTAQTTTRLDIAFRSTNGSTALFAWAGHIAAEYDWGPGRGATGVSGSPYHTRLISLDGSGGNQDRSLKATAVIIPPPVCAISAAQLACPETASLTFNSTGSSSGTGISYVWTLTNGNPSAGAMISGSNTGATVTVTPNPATGDFIAGGTFNLQLVVSKTGAQSTTCTRIPAGTIQRVVVTAAADPVNIDVTSADHNTTLTATIGATSTDTDPTHYTYQWSLVSGGTLSRLTNATSRIATYTSGAGDEGATIEFRVVATQIAAPNCSDDATTSVNLNSPGVCSVTPQAAVCQGTQTSHTGGPNPKPNTATYTWSLTGYQGSGTTTSNLVGANGGVSIGVNATQSYRIILSQVYQNTAYNTFCFEDVTVNPTPSCSITGPEPVCGGSTGNTYTSTVLPAGGTVAHSWSITGDGTITSGLTGASITVTAGASGSYTVTDNITRNGCISSCNKTVTVNPVPSCSITGPDPVCGGSTGNTYTSTVLPAGGTVTHSWSITGDGTITSGLTGASITVTAGASGSYTVTDNITRNGCISSCNKTVTVNPVPSCSITGPDPVCGGSTGNTYTSTVLPAGGTVAHSWSITGDGTITSGLTGASITVTAGASGSYTVTDNITRNGCISSCNKTITVNPVPSCSITGPDPVCGGSTGNTYTSTVLPAGGTVTHSWSITGDGTITSGLTGASITVTAGASGSYTVTDNITRNGCISSCNKTVTVNPVPSCSITGPGPVCGGSTGNTYTTTVLPAGGTVTHSWSITGDGTITSGLTGASITVTAGASGSYTVTDNITRNGCISSCNKTVNIVPRPTVSTVYNPPACDSREFTVDVPNPTIGYTYSIDQPGNAIVFASIIPTAQSPTVHFAGLVVGQGYIVTVDAGVAGCTATSSCDNNTPICPNNTVASRTSNTNETVTQPVETVEIALGSPTKVSSVPNPFTDKVRFSLLSAISGNGSLELYNVLGQKVGTVYQGFVKAGMELTKEYNVPRANRNTLIYIFKVGDQQVTGKLIGLK